MMIVDAKDNVAGRLASKVAKALINGERVTVINAQDLVMVGNKKSILEKYVPIQRKIIENLTPVLKKGGKIIYITCSAFKQENEDNISHFTENSSLKCISSNYFEGADLGADTMFVAVLEK